AYRQPQPVGHRRQVEPLEPPGQPGRGRRNVTGPRGRHPLPYDERPREDVPEPPPTRRDQRGDAGDHTQRHQDLDHPDQSPHQRVPEPDRPPVVPHHPQTARQLPQGLPVGQRLDQDRPAHQGQQKQGQGYRGLRGLVQRRRGRHHQDGQPDV